MKKKIITLSIGICVLLVSVSCNLLNSLISNVAPTATEVAPIVVVVTATSQATEIPQATPVTYLMEDDFSNPQSGWELYSGDYGTAGYEDGGYRVKSFIESQYNWGAAGVNFSDLRIDIDATVEETVAGGDDSYGVDCRLQDDGDGYGFRITSDGWAGIFKYVDSESSPLVDWFETNATNIGSINHITAICDGSDLQLLVNGRAIAQATDDTYTNGDIALSVVGFDTGTVSVLFDNIIVQKP